MEICNGRLRVKIKVYRSPRFATGPENPYDLPVEPLDFSIRLNGKDTFLEQDHRDRLFIMSGESGIDLLVHPNGRIGCQRDAATSNNGKNHLPKHEGDGAHCRHSVRSEEHTSELQ